MQFRRVGRTDLSLSVVGLGTVQLQMLPEQRAIDTLVSGFRRGVNWIHTAPDYGGVDPIIVEAIRQAGRPVLVAQGSPGTAKDLPAFFEHALHVHRTNRLALYGLGGIEDLEHHGENVWGPGGMIEYLTRQKQEGRLGGIFCSTHDSADGVIRLIESGAFDAVMVAWNPLGFHQQSHLYARRARGRDYEELHEYRERVFPLAAERGVSLLVMKPFAGGLLCRSQGLPPEDWFAGCAEPISPTDVLRLALDQPGVCAVVPGAASPEEAHENAGAGHAPLAVTPAARTRIDRAVASMRKMLCSRCGACVGSCSKSLSIPGLFRDAYIWTSHNETTGADPSENFFDLHPAPALACLTCVDRTCVCPQEIPIPLALERVHGRMRRLDAARLHPGPSAHAQASTVRGRHELQVLTSEVPTVMVARETQTVRFLVRNVGAQPWLAPQHTSEGQDACGVATLIDERIVQVTGLRNSVMPGATSQVVFTVTGPRAGLRRVAFALVSLATPSVDGGTVFFEGRTHVSGRPSRSLRHTVGDWLRATGLRSKLTHVAPCFDTSIAGEVVDHSFPSYLKAGTTYGIRLKARNTGHHAWLDESGLARLAAHVFIEEVLVTTLGVSQGEVPPGAETTWHFPLRAPDVPGAHRLRVEFAPGDEAPGLRRALAWRFDLQVVPAETKESVRLFELERRHNPWHYNPLLGIPESRDGQPFPLFIARGKGCRVWDVEGHEFLDYSMGWGSTVLGYADDRVQAAVRKQIDSTGAVLPFPHPIEMTVSKQLIDEFPGNDMVVFAKNGSDVCTVAARLARIATGKTVILSCGFHGWQDFALDYFSAADSGIPSRPERVLHKFVFNDRDGFLKLFAQHRDNLAAVMIEPAGPLIDDVTGLGGEPDAAFLQTVAESTREAGALLIFDEIITGFRYRHGSVQKATGVVPDLTCLGKALASGFPLAALLGPHRVFLPHFHKTHFNATFKSEVYALAAAEAALAIYRTAPAADHIWAYGERLRTAVEEICVRLGIAAKMTGPPFRMLLVFADAEPSRRQLKRTLLLQELLKARVITVSGMVLPSVAHDDRAFTETVRAYERALEVLAHADRTDRLHEHIELGTC